MPLVFPGGIADSLRMRTTSVAISVAGGTHSVLYYSSLQGENRQPDCCRTVVTRPSQRFAPLFAKVVN
jgi:hypothetical protein